MKKPAIQRLWGVLCATLILSACQKETSTTQEQQSKENNLIHTTGALPDDPDLVASVPVIMSSDFYNSPNALGAKSGGGRGGKQKDSDGDGIADAVDACPTQSETYNGYMDSDGCPDTVPSSTPTSDITAPTIKITAPVNGASVSGTVTITVSASDNVGVKSVSYSVDGVSVGTGTTAPFSIAWSTSTIADGLHTITARAYDAAGNNNVASISVSKSTTVLPPSTLPASVSLAMPPVQSQGAEFSCVAFAVGYAARSAEQYYKNNSTGYSYSSNVFSPEFLYNQTKLSDCGSGTSILKALDFLKTKGIATWQSMPYSSTNGCSLLPTSSQTSEAANFKIASYSKILNTDQTAIKTMLANKHPLIFMVAVDQSLMNAQAGFIWKSYSGSPGFYHAMTICGYDDAKHAYKVINSWGSGWGDAGYTWIDYNFLPQASYNSYVMGL